MHPNSGAGKIKDDGSDDHNLYEVKLCRKSFRLDVKDLKALVVRAVRQNKNGVMLIVFDDGDTDLTAEVRLVPGGRELIAH